MANLPDAGNNPAAADNLPSLEPLGDAAFDAPLDVLLSRGDASGVTAVTAGMVRSLDWSDGDVRYEMRSPGRAVLAAAESIDGQAVWMVTAARGRTVRLAYSRPNQNRRRDDDGGQSLRTFGVDVSPPDESKQPPPAMARFASDSDPAREALYSGADAAEVIELLEMPDGVKREVADSIGRLVSLASEPTSDAAKLSEERRRLSRSRREAADVGAASIEGTSMSGTFANLLFTPRRNLPLQDLRRVGTAFL